MSGKLSRNFPRAILKGSRAVWLLTLAGRRFQSFANTESIGHTATIVKYFNITNNYNILTECPDEAIVTEPLLILKALDILQQ